MDIQIFNNSEFGEIRTIEDNGKFLFCGSDVAKALGYAIPSKAVNSHCKGVSKMEVPTNGGLQQMLFITEGDLYRLIANSKLPTAEKFERWVFDEVLPTIRRTGSYVKPMSQIEMLALQAQAMVDMERKVTEIETKLNNAVEVFAQPSKYSWKSDMNHAINQICKEHGLNYQVTKGEMYKELEQVAHCNIATRQANLKERMKSGGSTYKECQAVSKIDVIERDPKLSSIFESIVRKYQAKYAVI